MYYGMSRLCPTHTPLGHLPGGGFRGGGVGSPVVTIDGKLHFLGGKNNSNTVFYSTNEIYDPVTDAWSTGVPMPYTRFAGAATVFNNEIYYLGGAVGIYSGPSYANNNNFDTTAGVWAGKLNMINRRVAMTSATVNNKIYVISGDDSTGNPVNWNHEYSITTVSSPVTVNPLPYTGTISGLTSVCMGSIITLSNPVTGTWSSINPGIATVGSAGIVTGVSPGNDTINYLVSNGSCSASTFEVIAVDPLPNAGTITGSTNVCAGSTIILTDAITGGTWTATNGNALVSSAGSVYGLTAGIDTVKYIFTNSCATATATKTVTINPLPNTGTISGPLFVCSTAAISLTDAAIGGTWSSSSSSVAAVGATGIVTGGSSGTATISYGLSNTCGTSYATYEISVLSLPAAGTVSGTSSVCTGANIILTDGTPGGAWSATNGRASVTGGVTTGITPGADTIVYSVSNICGTASATKTVTVNSSPGAGVILGATAVCITGSITLSDAGSSGTGTWSMTNGRATISSGVVTGVTVGIDTVVYTITSTCGFASTSETINILTTPVVGAINGPSSICVGETIVLTDSIAGGGWSASNGDVSLTYGGAITGVSAGIDNIIYSVGNACGSATTNKFIIVNPLPSAGAITGASSVCAGATVMLTDASSGGIWASYNASAAITSAGIVYGLTPGTDTIKYIVTNACGTASTTSTITVNALPNAGIITGSNSVCAGSNIFLTDAATGGTWSVTNVNATVGTTGAVMGVTSGIDTVRYTTANSCGTAIATWIIAINPMPDAGSITGISSVCIGSNISLSDAATGGSWTATNTSADITSAGVVYGLANGTDTLKYSVTNSCGMATATKTVAVNPLPDAGIISGSSTVCVGNEITLSNTVAGGTWSSSDAVIATIGSTGIITGLAAGTDTAIYTFTNTCGIAIASKVITVSALPVAGTISGSSSVCIGASITLTDGTAVGSWSAANGNAFISSVGVVHGAAEGIDTMIYTVTNSCGTATATQIITVDPLPAAGSIAGSSFVCISDTISLSETVTGGAWSASNANATILGGVVTGVTAGADTIVYTVTNGCGMATTNKIISVDPLPVAGIITGSDTVCMTEFITVTDVTAGGLWTTATGAASVSSAGLVTGIHPGADTVLYTVTNSCGSAIAKLPVIVLQTGLCSTGTNNLQEPLQDITLYPNPAQNSITITASEIINSVVISNLLGQDVFSGAYSTKEVVISLNQLPSGIYFVKINDTKVYKVVKQ